MKPSMSDKLQFVVSSSEARSVDKLKEALIKLNRLVMWR